MNRYNGSTYDALYPATTIGQVANGQQQIKVVNIALGTKWTAGDGYHTQVVTIAGGTANTKVALQAGYDVIAQMLEDGCTVRPKQSKRQLHKQILAAIGPR